MALPGHVRVLLLEDVATDAEIEVRELKRAGLAVEHRLVDTEETFRLELQRFSPHVIISDFSMPHFDGMAALALARELHPDIPFLFVSGTIGEEYAIRALKNGATDYVLKTNLIRLPAAVERALQEARDRRARGIAERKLAETRERLQSIFESLPDVLWSHELPSLRTAYISPAVAQIYGRPTGEFLAKSDLWQDMIHPDDRPAVVAAWQELLKGTPFDVEYRILRSDGELRWINDRGRLIRDSSGSAIRVDGLARDITDAVRQRERLARLGRIRDLLGAANAAFMRIRERHVLFEEFCRIAVSRGGFVLVRVVELDRSGKASVVATTEDAPGAFASIIDEYNRDPVNAQSLLAHAIRSGQLAVSNDVRDDERVPLRRALTERGNYSLVILPVRAEDRVVAVATLRAREPNFFDQEELALLSEMVANLEFALELIAKQDHITYLALYDTLTGLPNRTLFHERLTQAIKAERRGHSSVALVLIDLERFKAINDTLGQHVGDRVLQGAAQRLQEVAGDIQRVARLGGNLYALLFPGISGAEEVARWIEQKAATVLSLPLQIEQHAIRLAAQAGIAVFPDDGADSDTLLRNAEAALKRAKKTGERYLFYAPHINARVSEQVELEHRLRRAVDQGELFLHFQPKIELGTRRVVGLEALMRWTGPDGTLVSPAKFVPVLEETGLILEAGQQALAAATGAYRVWKAAGIDAPRIAVNVSSIQLRRSSFVGDIWSAVGLADNCGVDLEITESLLMENVEESIAKLRELRDKGMMIALDDFGTGYSSLAYLSRLPIDTVKIDRAFVHGVTENANDTSIVSTIISLAQALRLKVVAEGVETEEQARMLRLLRCDQMQGYLFSPPISLDETAKFLRAQTA